MESHPVDTQQNVEQVAQIEAAQIEVAPASPRETLTGRLWIVTSEVSDQQNPVCLSFCNVCVCG